MTVEDIILSAARWARFTVESDVHPPCKRTVPATYTPGAGLTVSGSELTPVSGRYLTFVEVLDDHGRVLGHCNLVSPSP